jgi:hypothetical protein
MESDFHYVVRYALRTVQPVVAVLGTTHGASLTAESHWQERLRPVSVAERE